MATKASRSIGFRLVHVPKNAARVVVNPSTVIARNGLVPVVLVKVDVYRDGERLDIMAWGPLFSFPYSQKDEESGLTWSYQPQDGGYRLIAAPLKKDLSTTAYVTTTDGEKHWFSLDVIRVNDGEVGATGPYCPTPQQWDDYPLEYEFQDGSEGCTRKDTVYCGTADGKAVAYECIKTHSKGTLKTDSGGPINDRPEVNYNNPSENQRVWKRGNTFDLIATRVLLAQNGRIEFLSGQALIIGDTQGVWAYLGVPTSSGAILYTGGPTEANSTFTVFKDGRVLATNMHISGNSTFKGFVFQEKTEITEANYASMSTTITYAMGSSRTELDLLKTGSWIEIKSLPASDTSHYTSLPAIRIGQAYTDAYRDYVRQFMGNEIMIYNTSGKSIAIDTGENSVEIKDDYACYFRMVMAPETSNGIKLERIKWEYTGPFQY